MTNECDNDPGEEFPAELAALEALAQRLDQARYSGPAWREPRPRLWAAVLKPVAAMAAAAAVMLAVAYLSLLIVHREPIPPVAVRLLPSPAPSPIAAPPATLDVSLAASAANAQARLLHDQTVTLCMSGFSLELPALDTAEFDGFQLAIPAFSLSTSFERKTQ